MYSIAPIIAYNTKKLPLCRLLCCQLYFADTPSGGLPFDVAQMQCTAFELLRLQPIEDLLKLRLDIIRPNNIKGINDSIDEMWDVPYHRIGFYLDNSLRGCFAFCFAPPFGNSPPKKTLLSTLFQGCKQYSPASISLEATRRRVLRTFTGGYLENRFNPIIKVRSRSPSAKEANASVAYF